MNFLHWFGALSFLTVALGALGTALALSHFLAEEILQWDALVTAQFVVTVAETQSAYGQFSRKCGLAEVMGKTASAEELGVDEARVAASMAEFLDHMRALPSAIGIKVFGFDRTLVWSSFRQGIAEDAAHDAMERKVLERAFRLPRSMLYTAIGRWDYDPDGALSEQIGSYYVENYVPLYDDTNRVVAVVEIDKHPARLEQIIHRGQILVWISLLSAGGFVFLALYWLARHATIVMEDQQRRLVDAETLGVIGEMSLAVAHGIRNPLAAIRSSAELALEDVPGKPRKLMLDIIAQADRLSYWLRDLLRYSRSSDDPAEPVNVVDVLDEAVQGFTETLAQAGIALDWRKPPGPMPRVIGNRQLLLQAFNSIISNALEVMAENGKLTVRCAIDHPRGPVRVSIEDNGRGMSGAQLSQVFRPFNTTKARGIGIGLALVKSTLERYGGKVVIESRFQRGTRVELRIPIAR